MESQFTDEERVELLRKRVQELRLAHGLTQSELARRAGVEASTVHLLEGTGKNKRAPYATTLARVVPALHTTSDYLLGLSPTPSEFYAAASDSKAFKDSRLRQIVSQWPRLDEIGKEAIAMLAAKLSEPRPDSGLET